MGASPAIQQGGTAPINNGGNEVLGAKAQGGNLPAGTQAAGAAPAAATAPLKATNRIVGSLPFTGLDLALVAAVGLALAGLGIGLRRLTGSAPAS
jgi:hypothetical protein